MNAHAIQRASVQWRCQSCGAGKPTSGECPECGDRPSSVRRRDRSRLIAPVSSMETFGNDMVQNNVVNVYGDVDCDNDYAPTSYRPVPEQGPSGLMRGFYAACTAVMWVSAITLGLVLAFFVVIFIKAFILHGL